MDIVTFCKQNNALANVPFLFPWCLLSYQIFYFDRHGDADYLSSSWAVIAERGRGPRAVRGKSPGLNSKNILKQTKQFPDGTEIGCGWFRRDDSNADTFHCSTWHQEFVTKGPCLTHHAEWRRFPVFNPLQEATESKTQKTAAASHPLRNMYTYLQRYQNWKGQGPREDSETCCSMQGTGRRFGNTG